MTGTPITPARPASRYASDTLLQRDLSTVVWTGTDKSVWPLSGGLMPLPPAPGVIMEDIKGLHAPLKHIDQQGAHQIGVDYLATTYDASEIDMTVTIRGADAAGRRRVYRRWLAGWEPSKTGRLTWFTTQTGEWWLHLRFMQEPRDTLTAGDMPSMKMLWSGRADFPFWQSYDSISARLVASSATYLADPAGSAPPNVLRLHNRGDQEGWPRHLLQGPGVFKIGDNGGPRVITVPLQAGELARITTLPMRRTVTELNTGANIYPRLAGRFSTPISAGASVRIPVTVTGAVAGVTSAISSLTPWRRWPE